MWNLYFGYALFLAPREDGSGVGGSIYWVVEVTEKVCFMGGIVTGILIWGTGQWERGIRWPRRWVYTTNRGLRGFNCKLVVIKQSWWREILSALSFFFSYGLFSSSSRGSYRYVDQSLLVESEKAQQKNGGHHALPNIHEDDETAGYEEDLAPGGDYVKLLLLPKPFSPNFRENWDIYRTEYWEKENERRALLRKKLKDRDRKVAKQQGGWLWWTGYRGWKRGKGQDLEKTHHAVHRLRRRIQNVLEVGVFVLDLIPEPRLEAQRPPWSWKTALWEGMCGEGQMLPIGEGRRLRREQESKNLRPLGRGLQLPKCLPHWSERTASVVSPLVTVNGLQLL